MEWSKVASLVYYHGSSDELPERFIVSKGLSEGTFLYLKEEYGLKDIKGGLFVTNDKRWAELFGEKVYEVISETEPLMLDNGIYIFPIGTKVETKRL